MDDLISVEWGSSKPSAQQPLPSAPTGNYYPALRPTPPLSGRATPLNGFSTGPASKPPSNNASGSKSSTPVNDSFANLVSFNATQSSKTISLQEQQKNLQEQKIQQEAEKRAQFDSHFGLKGPTATAAPGWSSLDDGRTTPNRVTAPPTYTATSEYGGQKLSKVINKPFAAIPTVSAPTAATAMEDDEDLLAAFNASAPVDKSSHMPAILHPSSSDNLGGQTRSGLGQATQRGSVTNEFHEDYDDDPFGLGTDRPSHRTDTKSSKADTEDDDVLGLLGRPVSEFPKTQPAEEKSQKPGSEHSSNPQDRAIAELVDMGFAPEKSRLALESTESGTDMQAAVSWLLSQAHEDSRKKKQPQANGSDSGPPEEQRLKRASGRRKGSGSRTARPAWMNEQDRLGASRNRPDSKSPAKGDKEPTQLASEIGKNLFSTAGKLWKTGAERLNQAVSDFNSDSDSSQPKWMREAHKETTSERPRVQQQQQHVNEPEKKIDKGLSRPSAVERNVTDEALMLESGDAARPTARNASYRTKPDPGRERERDSSADQPRRPSTRPREQENPVPRFMQQSQKHTRDPISKLSRQAVEEEAAQAYISPARRKKTTPKPTPPEPVAEPDLLFDSAKSSARPITSESRPKPIPQTRPSPNVTLPTRPPPPQRNIPLLSPSALKSSTTSRQAGTAAFKRGDYAEATTHYSTSLSSLPQKHPLTIPVLTNRALSHSKTGDPKGSIVDAETVIALIGPSRGVGETIDLGGDEGSKAMDTYWGKAMTRKAEALEHLERFNDAAAVWRTCVEAGVGGATSMAGRNRSEAAARPKPAPTKRPPARPKPRPSALDDFAPTTAQSAEAVTRLRAAHAAADKLDDEKFALADQVDARVTKWQAGKEDNLRALLSTLENVLWEEAGWKKVGMGDVLLPGKVKLVYMKGIAKVHPDKVSS